MKKLQGPYELSADIIERTVPSGPGVYALGYVDLSGTFRIERFGRHNHDLQSRLRDMIGTSNAFKYLAAPSRWDAFMQECELFHKLHPQGNITHPQRPSKSGWQCPHCHQLPFA